MSGKTSIVSEEELAELAESAQRQLDKEEDIMALEKMLRMSIKEDLVKYLRDHPEMLPPLEKAINDDFAKYEVSKAAIQARNIIRKQTTLIRADERREERRAAIQSVQRAARNATIKSSREREREGEGRKLYKTMNRKARKSRKARKARKARKSRKARKN